MIPTAGYKQGYTDTDTIFYAEAFYISIMHIVLPAQRARTITMRALVLGSFLPSITNTRHKFILIKDALLKHLLVLYTIFLHISIWLFAYIFTYSLGIFYICCILQLYTILLLIQHILYQLLKSLCISTAVLVKHDL